MTEKFLLNYSTEVKDLNQGRLYQIQVEYPLVEKAGGAGEACRDVPVERLGAGEVGGEKIPQLKSGL